MGGAFATPVSAVTASEDTTMTTRHARYTVALPQVQHYTWSDDARSVTPTAAACDEPHWTNATASRLAIAALVFNVTACALLAWVVAL